MAAFALGSLAACAAHANTYCINDATALKAALADAGNGGAHNGQENIIHVVAGNYPTSGAPFTFGTTSAAALTVDGGWNLGCTIRSATVGATVLDGSGLAQTLSISTNGNLTLRGLTIANGNYSGSAGGGAAIALNGLDASRIVVFDSNVVRDNVDNYGGGGGMSIYGNGTVYVENSVFSGNSGLSVAAFSVSLTTGTVYITNVTIADNTNTESGHAITSIGSANATGYVSNTVSYGNHGTAIVDYYLYGFAKVTFVNDAYASIDGTVAGSSGNLVGIDPRFAGAGDYHLQSTSPLLRAGTVTPAGGLPASDIEGHPRSVNGQVDIGAYESVDFIFADGFDTP